MGSFASLEEIAAAALRRREAQHARLSAQHEQEPELDSLSSSAPPERASSFWGLAALGEGLEALPARLGEGLGGLERRVGSGLEGFPERAVERLEGLLHHESPLLAATMGKSPSLYSLRAGLSPSGSLTPHPADHYGGGSRAAGGRVRLASKSQRSSPQRSHRGAGAGVRLRRSLSLPTSSGMRRVARRAKGTAEQLQTKALQVAHAQEQLLYFFYTTRDALAATTRLDYLTDPLALWRIYWRWFGIVLLLCNASLLLAVGWARHRCEVDPLCQRPLCSGAEWSALLPWDKTWDLPWEPFGWDRTDAAAAEKQAAALALPPNPHDPVVVVQQCLAQVGDAVGSVWMEHAVPLARQLLAHGGANMADLERSDWLGGGDNNHAGRRRPDPCRSERWVARSGAAVQLFSVGELLLSLRTAYGNTATSRALARHGYRRGYAYLLLALDTALSLDFLAVHGPDALLLTLDRWFKPPERPPDTTRPSGSEHPLERLATGVTGVWRNTSAGWTQWWDGVQRAWRDTPLMRAVVGYQRLNELPPPPKPIQWLLDEKLLPAYFGEGLQALVGRIEVLPTVGDIILETMLMQAFVGSFVRSAKALILLASAAKAIRVRRRLRHEQAAGRIARAWRRHARRRRASRQVARLRWRRTVLGQCL